MIPWKNGTSRLGLYGSAPPPGEVLNSMVTQARIVAQYIMTNSVTAAADDMKVLKK